MCIIAIVVFPTTKWLMNVEAFNSLTGVERSVYITQLSGNLLELHLSANSITHLTGFTAMTVKAFAHFKAMARWKKYSTAALYHLFQSNL